MKTLLLISGEHGASSLDGIQTIPGLRVIARRSVADAENALGAGVFDLVLVLGEWSDARSGDVRRLRTLSPRVPLLVATASAHLATAYALGADAALPWPEGSATLPALVERWLAIGAPTAPTSTSASEAAPTVWPAGPIQGRSPLEILRDFSKVLGHSLDEPSLTRQLVQQLAEILGVARMALYLESDSGQSAIGPVSDGRLVCSAAIGVSAEIAECVQLTPDAGLGRLMRVRGGVFSRHAPHLRSDLLADPQIGREFDALGCEMAVALRDGDKVIGVALLGGRITGAPFTADELNLGYFLMGELGMAIRNSRLHRLVAREHELLSGVLESLSSGSLVVGTDLRVLHANRAAVALLGVPPGRLPAVGDLPPSVQEALRASVDRGAETEPILEHRVVGTERLFRYTITPLGGAAAAGRPVIVLVEDWTTIHETNRAEIQTANTKLIGTIAARFAHEIRNSLVPLSTHAQLFEAQAKDPAFLESLRSSLLRETQRIRRLSDQMLYLAGPESDRTQSVPVGEMLNDAFVGAQEIAGRPGQLVCTGEDTLSVRGARASLTHAFQEILANSLQAANGIAGIRVKVSPAKMAAGRRGVTLEISDTGKGFDTATAARATEPFFTTRAKGVGLGLGVARKIVERHGGSLVIHERTRPDQPDLTLTLPAP